MTVAVIGLNYRTAPLELREQLTLTDCARQIALEDLRGYSARQPDDLAETPILDEAVILSTCNRLEVYIATTHVEKSIAMVERFLCELQNLALDEVAPHFYSLVGEDAVAHLMRVACGLDSMILGEPQILGQVTNAYEDAHAAGMSGTILSRVFAQAIHTGKRARTETTISRYTTSVSHAAVRLMLDQLNQHIDARVLVVGAGDMALLAAQSLDRLGVHQITFINRTYLRAQSLADRFGGSAMTWSQLDEALVWADAILSATGAPHTVIYRQELEHALSKRGNRPLIIVDIAVPRDVEPNVRDLPNVQMHDIDDLRSVVDGSVDLRKAAVPQVESIIQFELGQFTAWYHSRQVVPVIRTLREWAQSVAEEELAQTLTRLPDADERTRQLVSRLAHRLVNRLMHAPTSRLRLYASEGNGFEYAHAVRELFSLDERHALSEPEQMPARSPGRFPPDMDQIL